LRGEGSRCIGRGDRGPCCWCDGVVGEERRGFWVVVEGNKG